MVESNEKIQPPVNLTEYLLNKDKEEFKKCLETEFNVHLKRGSRTLDDLYEDLHKHETWFERDPESPKRKNEIIRHTEPANIDIFYVSSDGKVYLLKEDKRLTLPKESSPQDYYEGRVSPVSTRLRPTDHSISEKMYTHTKDAEEPLAGATRGIFEELFKSVINIPSLEEDRLKHFISERLRPNGFVVSAKGKLARGNSYKGLKAVYHKHNFVLILKQEEVESQFPNIPLVQIDKPVYEFIPKPKENKNYLNTLSWQEIENIQYLTFPDEAGKVQTRVITAENSPDILHEVMITERERKQWYYSLRCFILKSSQGKLKTYQVFTKDPDIIDGKYHHYRIRSIYLGNPENWLDEQNEIHRKIIETEFAKVLTLSQALNRKNPIPTIYMFRGNNGAGKSTYMRTVDDFKNTPAYLYGVHDQDVGPDSKGVINTDFYDFQLMRELTLLYAEPVVQATQVHEEGMAIERKIRNLAYKEARSIIFDKRFSIETQVIDVLGHAGKRNIKIFDLDVPLLVSAIRVLVRDREKEAPIVPFSSILNGFVNIRKGRDPLIELVKQGGKIQYYLLLDTSFLPPTEVAWSVRNYKGQNDIQKAKSYSDEEYDSITSPVNRKKAAHLGKTRITEKFINQMLRHFPSNPKTQLQVKEKLRKYLGKTMTEALDEASKYR